VFCFFIVVTLGVLFINFFGYAYLFIELNGYDLFVVSLDVLCVKD
jgi:hypothetical protein